VETNPKFKYQMLKTLFSLFVFQISIFVFLSNILANSPIFGIITLQSVVAVAAMGKQPPNKFDIYLAADGHKGKF